MTFTSKEKFYLDLKKYILWKEHEEHYAVASAYIVQWNVYLVVRYHASFRLALVGRVAVWQAQFDFVVGVRDHGIWWNLFVVECDVTCVGEDNLEWEKFNGA